MLINKIAAVTVAMTLVFSMSGAAFARDSRFHFTMPTQDIKVTNEHTEVLNVAGSVANTGLNSQVGGWSAKQTLYTGAVSTVDSTAVADINTTVIPTCNTCNRGSITVKNNRTEVANIALTVANSGANRQTGSLWSNQTTGTGSVDHVTSGSQISVNYTDFSVSAN